MKSHASEILYYYADIMDHRTYRKAKYYLRQMNYFDRLARHYSAINKLAVYYEEIANLYCKRVVSILKKAKKNGGAL